MRADEHGSLFIAAALIEDGLSYMHETVDFQKLAFTTRHQFVGYGHFHRIFAETAPHILSQAGEIFEKFRVSYPTAIEAIHSRCFDLEIHAESPIGLIINRAIVAIESAHISRVISLIAAYDTWLHEAETNPLPLALSPDSLFSHHMPDLILSSLPRGTCPPDPTTIEEVESETGQALLYRALLHAKQRRTTEAADEMTRCCLRMTDDDDPASMARSAVALAQIFDLLGMKDESILALNESIARAKGLSDASVIATAIALKAQIDASDAGWKYAAAVSEPHALAAIRMAFGEGQFPAAVAIEPFIAAKVFGEKDPRIAELVPLTERTLPIRVLSACDNCDWPGAANLILQLDVCRAEVRATALAFAVALFEASGETGAAAIYRNELQSVMAIEIGHFSDLKGTIEQIARVVNSKGEINLKELPLDRGLLYRLRWMAAAAEDERARLAVLTMCGRYGVRPLFEVVAKKCALNGDDISGVECRNFSVDSLVIETVLEEVSKMSE
jgi:hypothetical protein